MREIKFRAWQPNDGAMGSHMLYDVLKENSLNQIREWGWILMQFTGLKDKNGKEIWEGDIVEQRVQTAYGSWVTIRGVMEWRAEQAQFQVKADLDPNVMGDQGGDAEPPVVIGNIYENPELLEQKVA